MKQLEGFTKYEIARILGARALQITMDAPLLLKFSEKELEEIKFDALRIAEKEFYSGVLPISVKRPFPRMKKEKLKEIKEEKIDDTKIIEKEREIEKEIKEKAGEMGLVNTGDEDETSEPGASKEE